MIQGFPHPGGLQHPGMPHGQPMGPGHGAHPGQPMGQPMQMHPGVSGPNGPHVTQAGPMMAGMQPGVGGPGGGTPNSHAMQHLAPQMQQHQMMQQQMMSNPALVRQMQQQQYLQHQRMMQQQQGQGGMPMNFPNSGHPGMTPQQFAALQSGNGPQGVVLPQHLQMQQAMMQQRHQQALQLQHQQPSHQQQQAAQQQQAQHQQAQAQQAQQAQAQQAQQQHAQSMAMQHAASQQSNQGQPTPQSAPSSQPQQGPMRPPTAMGNTPQAHSSPAPPPSQQQSAPPQATPTTQAPQQSPAPQQSQPQSQQQQQQAQQSQNQQQGQASGQQQPQQQAQNSGQAAANQQRQLLNNQQAAAAARLQQQQQAKMFRGNAMLKLLQFTDHLGKFQASQQANDIDYWRSFVAEFFSEEGELRQTIHDNSQNKPKQFDICFAALPRYFFKQYESGVEQIQIFFGDSIEKSLNNQCHFVEARGAKFIYWFANGTQVVGTGRLTALIGQGDKIETLEFNHNEHQTYLSRSQLEELFARGSPNQKQSPRMTKTTGKQRNQQRLQQPIEPTLALSDLPSAPITDFGVTEAILSYLEIGETLSHMQPLISYSQQHSEQTPGDALRSLVSQYNQAATVAGQQQGMQQQQAGAQQQFHNQHLMNAQNGMHPGQQMQPGVRTPSNPGQGFMMSPAVQNSLLPGQNPVNGSPHMGGNVNLNAANLAGGHTSSPAMGHMQAPNMVAQLSQQGNSGGSTATLSSGTAVSANTSPNVSGKRRRPSAVKGEGDDTDGPGVNGAAKVKASPRGGGNKRIKGNQ